MCEMIKRLKENLIPNLYTNQKYQERDYKQ